jgi:Carboxypeptidase regulatory-like domain
MSRTSAKFGMFAVLFSALLLAVNVFAQETTGGLQGTVKDPSGAVISKAQVELTGAALAGKKSLETDNSGYYRFANLPPGTYMVTAKAGGFSELKREGVTIEVGHLPTLDLVLPIGAAGTVVEVTGEAPVIDVTTNQNQTNVTSDVIANEPHGYSFQSVIQFAPMARNEPLGGMTQAGMGTGGAGGTGGSTPGSSGNGQQFGYSVGGASDSENGYLVEGQDTEQLSGGYSKANVPFQFIQEVQIKSSGIEAEHGGALGGVVNVVMKKGSNAYHGSLFSTYESNGLDADNNGIFLRYNPTAVGTPGFDPQAQDYNPKQDHFRIIQSGFTIGGPILKDRLWFFLGFAPQFNTLAKTVDFGANDGGAGNQYFTQDHQLYYSTARLDYVLTQKIRVFGSWLYQYSRETGVNLPISDPVNAEAGYVNTSTGSPLTSFSHGLGFVAPNATYNTGADITLTPKIISTTRFGYFFENYHDFGWQTSTPNLVWNTDGIGALDNAGNPLPAGLAVAGGTATAPYTSTFTPVNANKHYQFDEDFAFFKSGWAGTHNIKVGYQLNHLVNVISQNGNVPLAFVNVGAGQSHSPSTTVGVNNCTTLTADWGTCAGQYGYLTVQDFATVLTAPASDWNHAFFAQDAWTIGHGLTINAGIRIEKESLPVPAGLIPTGFSTPQSINFSWGDKIAPRLGAAWDVKRNGKMKIFASYGVVNDVMKLLLAQTSWGAQGYNQCSYALGPDGTANGFSVSDIDLVFQNGRACPSGLTTLGANFASGATPPSLIDAKSGISLIENANFRPYEPVAPGVKPYRQHEFVAGVDYQVAKDWAIEARYDRRRLDHVIEDASLADPTVGEVYSVVNPGQGVDRTIDGYANFLQSLGQAFGPGISAFNSSGTFGSCPTCPALPQAIRNYDGLEFRLTKATSRGWAGLFSYTYSRLWGNYTGLTTTDQNDGDAAGRNSPDTSRAFDEPFFYYAANGKPNNGLLPTDRPNTLKGNVYYQLPWKGMMTSIGLFQFAYQGSPVTSYIDLTAATIGIPYESTYIYGRDQWVNPTVDPATGAITLGNPSTRRTPWFTQTDFNISHSFKVNKNNDRELLRFDANVSNLFNQHAVVQYYQGLNSQYFASALHPGYDAAGNGVNLADGAFLYQTLMGGYNPQQWINGVPATATTAAIPAVTLSSQYGQPNQYQLLRNMRLGVSFTF